MPTQKDFDLLKEFGLEDLPDDKKVILQEKIIGLVESRFNRVRLGMLTEKDKKEHDELLAGEDLEKMNKFIQKKVPNFAEIHQEIVEDLKKEMVEMKEAIL